MLIANAATFQLLHRFFTNKAFGYAYYSTVTTPLPPQRDYNGFIPSTAPPAYREERGTFFTPPTHYGRGAGTSIAGETLHNRETAMCGKCSSPMLRHDEDCERDFGSELGDYVHDYYQYGQINYDRNPRTYIVPHEDYSGYEDDSESEEFYRDSEWQSIYDLGDYEVEELHWRDSNERECTSVLAGKRHYRYNKFDPYFQKVELPEGYAPDGMFIDTSAIVAHSKTVFVEGIGGYHSIKLLDPFITAKSHAKMLNVYKQDGFLRIGGLKLVPSHEDEPDFPGMTWTSITATCSHHGCRKQDERKNWLQQSFSISGYELTREQMEDFVYSLIRHGNNHAAPWFKDRTVAKATHRTIEHSTFRKIGTRWLEDEDGFYEVGVYDKEPVRTSTSKAAWQVVIPKDSRTFYKVHQRNCDLSCDPLAVVC